MRTLHTMPSIIFAVLGVSLLLAYVAGISAARSLSLSNQSIRATWRSLEFQSSLTTIRCPVTLEGSFHSRTIAKVARSLIGSVTRVVFENESCTNSTFNVSNLPWHLTYESFDGTLPTVTGINILLSRFRLRFTVPGFCSNGEYGTETDNMTGIAAREASGALTTLTWVEGRNTANLVMAREFCPGSIRLRGEATVTLLGSTARITVTLI